MSTIIRFTPQAWVNDYAVDTDPEGPTEWESEVVNDLLADYRDKADALRYEPWFVDDPACPQWIKDHRGPFYIEVICPRCGGPWGFDITCSTCTDDEGDPRPIEKETP